MYPITLTRKIKDIEICGKKLGELHPPEFEYPWEIIAWFQANIGKILEKQENGDAKIHETVVVDGTAGKVIIDDGAVVGPFVYLEGPCYIGKNVTIQPHAQIRKKTSIGHDCKIGGEVSGTIFEPYSNKAHHGFVGDSYIGSWVNLGAGTSTSNLKNTYGPVRVEYQGEKIDTGMQFLGCILGDYVKSAVNTSIYTGKVVGVAAQLFGCCLEPIPSFVMDADGGKEEFELEAAIRMQERMFTRRDIEQTDKDIQLLKDVFEKTKKDREKL